MTLTDPLKPLDSAAWLRRLGRNFDLGAEVGGALAERLRLPVVALTARLTPAHPYDCQLLTFLGRFEVRLERECVVSLKTFQEALSGDFERSYTLSSHAPPVPKGREEAEAFPYAGLSLMDMLADEIALTVTPFPRRPNAVLPAFDPGPELGDTVRPNPFALLKGMKQ